ncbi:metal-dependent transcriptional regulator [Halobellus rufus]|uniref:metal-dependent transcriptional regulator n=1 Tax=Halobellus rufus TaxID=1448860 RepID=UPI000679AF4B|nr:metal-dependent transcriptional regulator [Halobellus rufus]
MSDRAQYLLALFIEEHRAGTPVSTGRLAERLDRSAAAATEMIQRLDDDGLVSYEPYEGAALTGPGRERAATLHETYVVLSWFFRDVLDLDTYEREAREMADLVSPAVAECLVTLLFEDEADMPDASSATTLDRESFPDE